METVEEIRKLTRESRDLLDHIWKVVRVLAVVVGLLFLLYCGLELQLLRRNQDVDQIEKTVASLKTSVEDIGDSADSVEKAANRTADDLAAAIEASETPNPAVEKALQEVHQILVLLQNLEAEVRQARLPGLGPQGGQVTDTRTGTHTVLAFDPGSYTLTRIVGSCRGPRHDRVCTGTDAQASR